LVKRPRRLQQRFDFLGSEYRDVLEVPLRKNIARCRSAEKNAFFSPCFNQHFAVRVFGKSDVAGNSGFGADDNMESAGLRLFDNEPTVQFRVNFLFEVGQGFALLVEINHQQIAGNLAAHDTNGIGKLPTFPFRFGRETALVRLPPPYHRTFFLPDCR
jgi:hypothetical protein